MALNLTAQDRSSLIRLASNLPVGSPERRAILAGLKSAASRDEINVPKKHIWYQAKVTGNFAHTPPKGKKAASEGRIFKSVGSVRTGAGNAQVVFDPEVTTEDTARRTLQFIKSIPTRDLSMSAARRFEIFDNPEDVSQRLDEVGIVADDLSNGAFDFRTGIVYACVWDGYASSFRTLMHEIGHSIVGRDEAMAESWYANRQHMDAKWR